MLKIAHTVETFLSESGMAPTKFGTEAVDQKHLVRRLRDGGDVTSGTAEKIEKFIAAYWRKHSKPESGVA